MDSDLFLLNRNLWNECLKPVFEYKISFWICVLVLWIHKGYCVVKKLVWDVRIKAFRYTNYFSIKIWYKRESSLIFYSIYNNKTMIWTIWKEYFKCQTKFYYKNLPFLTPFTVGENIIASTKIRNNYGAIQSLNFLFSIAPCKVITLNPLCTLFCISSLLPFWELSL